MVINQLNNYIMNKLEFQNKWNELKMYKAFEIQVTDLSTGSDEYLLFGIELKDDKFTAKHVSLTWAQKGSQKISFVSIDIDYDFSIDENLQSLYEKCIDAVIMSDFYELRE